MTKLIFYLDDKFGNSHDTPDSSHELSSLMRLCSQSYHKDSRANIFSMQDL